LSQIVASWSDCLALVDIVTSCSVAIVVDEAVGAGAHVTADCVCTGGVFVAFGLASQAFVDIRAGEAVAGVALFTLAFAHVSVIDTFAHRSAFRSF